MKGKNIILLMALISHNSQSTTYDLDPTFNLGTDLIASFEFNGNTNDSSGNNNNGTGENILLTTDRFGNTDSAFEFNGTNSFISINTNYYFT